MTRLPCRAVLAGLLTAASSAAAQTPAVRVAGSVYDSLSRRPLAGARVEAAAISQSGVGHTMAATTDSAGRFEFSEVPAGRYAIVFRHDELDSLGIEIREQAITIGSGSGPVRLATPSALTIMRAMCPSMANADVSDSSSLLTGHLYSGATDTPVRDAGVSIGWQAPTLQAKRLEWTEQAVTVKTSVAGWFAVCGVPGDAPTHVQASVGTDSTGIVDVRVPPRSIRHVSLYLPTLAKGVRGQIVGHVRDAQRRPLARVSIVVAGRERAALTDSSGAFRVDSLPDGTASLELRAIGYSPIDTVIRVSYEHSVNADFVLTRATVLAPIVSRASGEDRSIAVFEQHRKSAAGGYFVRPVRLEGYPSVQSIRSLVQNMPGMPRSLDAWKPIVFLDGVRSIRTLAEIDRDLDPDDIVGIEVYTGIYIPADYVVDHKGRTQLVAIWTKAGPKFSR